MAIEKEEYNPFGLNFQLSKWSLSDPIDKYENRPYNDNFMTIIRL